MCDLLARVQVKRASTQRTAKRMTYAGVDRSWTHHGSLIHTLLSLALLPVPGVTIVRVLHSVYRVLARAKQGMVIGHVNNFPTPGLAET